MNRTLLALAVMAAALGATAARADDFHSCGPRPTYAPVGQSWNQGQYQVQTTQVWVPGTMQQVWVPGECRQQRRGRHFRFQRCTPGSYQTVTSAGHYENRQNWVWVAHTYQRPQQYGRDYGRQQYGRQQYGRDSGRQPRYRQQQHGAVPIGY